MAEEKNGTPEETPVEAETPVVEAIGPTETPEVAAEEPAGEVGFQVR